MRDHDADHDDALIELDAALQVEPSRAFADGVRARVNRSRTNTARVWWGLAAAASIGLATMALWRPSVEAPVQVAAAPVHAPAPVAPKTTPDLVTTLGGRVFRPGNASAGDRVSRLVAPPVVRVTSNEASEPRLEVLTNQGAVLQAIWADYRGRSLVIAEGAPTVESPAPEIIVNPVVVAPIVVGEIGKEQRPAGATPVIRRASATRETK